YFTEQQASDTAEQAGREALREQLAEEHSRLGAEHAPHDQLAATPQRTGDEQVRQIEPDEQQQNPRGELGENQPLVQLANQGTAQGRHDDPHAELVEQGYGLGIREMGKLPLQSRLRLNGELSRIRAGREARD